MMPLRRPLIAALAATGALAVGVPTAGASTAPIGSFSLPTAFAGFQRMPAKAALWNPGSVPAGACVTSPIEGQGRTGGVAIQTCGLSFIGPISTVSTVIGPTIITGAFTGSSIVSGGNVAIGP
jgi:hypothetical protein